MADGGTGGMRYGAVLPGGTAPEQLGQALLAERAGWDGVFVWEAAYGVDAWTLLAAMAARTSRIRLGTLLTPLPWRRPWKVASQVATLDQLSDGRAILAVGVGAVGTALPDTGEVTEIRPRAEMLDEGIRAGPADDGPAGRGAAPGLGLSGEGAHGRRAEAPMPPGPRAVQDQPQNDRRSGRGRP